MRKSIVLISALAAVVYTAPLKADIVFDTSTGLGLTADGTAFHQGLYEGYIGLRDERVHVLDPLDGEHFNHKARRAARRSNVMPDRAQDRRLIDEDVAVFKSAWKRIHDAWDRGGRSLAPADAAKAQVSYDCWIEAREGANSGYGLGNIASFRNKDAEACKAAFEEAMAAVEAAANLHLTMLERKPAPAMAAAPAPAPAMEAPKPFIVFFGFDSADITAAGNRVIDDAMATAERMDIVDFTITGHADRAGVEAYNLQLSLRRANAVREELLARGVKASGISVAGRGEAENAVATADGVREAANRRVEIILL